MSTLDRIGVALVDCADFLESDAPPSLLEQYLVSARGLAAKITGVVLRTRTRSIESWRATQLARCTDEGAAASALLSEIRRLNLDGVDIAELSSSAQEFALQCMREETSTDATRLWLTLRPSTARVECRPG